MTTVDVGIFVHAAAIGWLGILFLVPPIGSRWRPLAFAAALCAAGIMLSWWFGGHAGAAVAALGVAAGALGAASIRFNHIV